MLTSYRFVLALTLGAAFSLQALAQVSGQWDDRFALTPGCDGDVAVLAERPDGKIYVGGRFRHCDGVLVNSLALYDPVGNTYEPIESNGVAGVSGGFGQGPSQVSALAWVDGDLYVGGRFDTAGTLDVNRIARWDGSNWHRLGTALSNGVWQPGLVGGSVWALAHVDGSLYVGGTFELAGTVEVSNIARWSGGQWHDLPDGSSSGVNSQVNVIEPIGSSLAVGGWFSEVGGNPVNRLALWNGSNWSAIGQTAPGVGFLDEGRVDALILEGNSLYVAGPELEFQNADSSVCVDCVMRWDGVAWTAYPVDALGDYRISSLAFHQGDLFAGGFNAESASADYGRRSLLRRTGSQWQVVGGGDGLLGSLSALIDTSVGLLAGGRVRGSGSLPSHGLIRYDGGQFHAAGQVGGQGLPVDIPAIAEFQGDLYTASYDAALREAVVRRWDGSQWQALPGRFDFGIAAMTVYQGMLYVAGNFAEIDGQPAPAIVRYDGSEWLPVGAGIQGNVNALEVFDGQLIATGSFEQAGGVAVNHIAAWDGSTWSPLEDLLGEGLTGGSLPRGYALASNGSDLFVTGRFEQAGGASAYRTARWDGSNWFSMGIGIGSLDAGLTDLAWHAGALHISGYELQTGDGDFLGPLARFVGGQWESLVPPSGFISIRSLASHGGHLYALSLRNSVENDLRRWDGQNWQTLGDGIGFIGDSGGNGGQGALLVNDERVVAGGVFARAGPHASRNIAMFHFTPPSDSIFSDRFQAAFQ